MGRGRRSLLINSISHSGDGASTSRSSDPPRSPSDARQSSRTTKDVASTPISSKHRDSPPLFGDVSPLQKSPSPVRFFCTQDGSHGEDDVIWDYYSPLSEKDKGSKHLKTPIRRRRVPINFESSPLSRIPNRQKFSRRITDKNNYMRIIQQLAASNKMLSRESPSDTNMDAENIEHGDMLLTPERSDKTNLFEGSMTSVTKIFEENTQIIPTSKSHFEISKCNNEVMESDDSINEFLFTATQQAEDELKNKNNVSPVDKRSDREGDKENKLLRKVEIVNLNNDSFDNMISGMNDSYIAILSQTPSVSSKLDNNSNSSSKGTIYTYSNLTSDESLIKNISREFSSTHMIDLNDSKIKFGRHNSMPISPITKCSEKPSTRVKSTFIRHKSMPLDSNSPIKQSGPQSTCTPEEIRRKREAAKEKLLAKLQDSQHNKVQSDKHSLKNNFVLGNSFNNNKNIVTSSKISIQSDRDDYNGNCKYKSPHNVKYSKNISLQEKIEQKRREAQQKLLMKKLLLK